MRFAFFDKLFGSSVKRKLSRLVDDHRVFCRDNLFEVASIDKLINHKSADKLFVLGSGSSINNLSVEQWDEISCHDSVGINRWFYHDFVPRFYLMDPPRNTERDISEIVIEGLLYRKKSYANCPIILTYPAGGYNRNDFVMRLHDLDMSFSLALSLNIEAQTESALRRELKKLSAQKILRMPELFWIKTASLDWILLTAVRMGYKEVVFCGVDLNDTRYFYETRPEWVTNSGLRMPRNLQKGKLHKTFDSEACFGGVPIDQVLSAYCDELRNNYEVECFVSHQTSVLSKIMSVYQWNVSR